MITLPQLLAAVPPAAYGIIALWAAGSRRHWFLRAAIVTAVALAPCLIPAYELALAAIIEVIVIIAAVSRWRFRSERPTGQDGVPAAANSWRRMSMQDLLLAMVVIAVAATVARRMVRLSPYDLIASAAFGAVAGAATVTSAWLVVTRRSWLVRVATALVALALVTAAATSIDIGRQAWIAWDRNPSAFGRSWIESVGSVDLPLRHWATTTFIVMSITSIWTGLLIKSRLATTLPQTESTTALASETLSKQQFLQLRLCQVTFAIFTVAILLIPALLLGRLAQPMQYPIKPIAAANSYDTLVSLGESFDFYEMWGLTQNSQMILLIRESDDRLKQLREAIREPFHWPFPHALRGYPSGEFSNLHSLLAQRCKEAEQAGRANERPLISSYADHFLFTQIYLSALPHHSLAYFIPDERYALKRLWQLREQMTQSELQDTIDALCLADARPERWQIADRFRFYDLNQKQWRLRLKAILDDWSGIDHYRRDAELAMFFRTVLRLVTIDLAIAQFQAQHARLPQSLSELVPNILPAIPADPFTGSPMAYVRTDHGYRLYSFGPDRKDDRAEHTVRYWIIEQGDITLSDYDQNYAAPTPRTFQAIQ